MSDADFLRLAYAEALKSPDPSTQNGAIIVSKLGNVIGIGHNRFARGLKVTQERLIDKDQKLPRTVHSEVAAILDATSLGWANSLVGSMMYAAWFACDRCAVMIIESGIRKVVGHRQHPGVLKTNGRWSASTAMGLEMLREAGVEYRYHDGILGCDPIRFGGEMWTP